VATTVATSVAKAVATTHRSASARGIQLNDTDLASHKHTPNAKAAEITATAHRTGRDTRNPP
jgi:hypothetical protein